MECYEEQLGLVIVVPLADLDPRSLLPRLLGDVVGALSHCLSRFRGLHFQSRWRGREGKKKLTAVCQKLFYS